MKISARDVLEGKNHPLPADPFRRECERTRVSK